ncbi:coiled-coil domain-containing protein 142 isoform X3 [Tachypleus tridentatus]|uniref:coiled-coil domain-containing protein 142 isoform X3 n=1 Tax=Tachypleus tridentatus TaxID=6853 RepID=UPI003FD5958B
MNKLESCTEPETGESQSEELRKDLVVSVSSVLHILTNCSQTLLLKFLFAFSCAQASQSHLDTLIEGRNSTKLSVMHKKWQKNQNNSGTESCAEMEHSYWREYWKQFGNQLFLYLTNAQPHEMEILDRIDIWTFPKYLAFPLIQDLKDTKEEKEHNTETIYVVNSVYWALMWEACMKQWQHRMSQFLVASQESRFFAVPLESGGVSSDPGNIVFRALEELFFYIKEMKVQQLEHYSVAYVTVMQLLNATLDQFLTWSRQKLEATLTSWKVCEYLLIGCSDVKRVCHLLDSVNNLIDSLNRKQANGPGMAFYFTLNKELDDQIQRLKAIEMHVAEWFLIQCNNVTISIFKESSQSVKMWRRNKTTTKEVGSYINAIILDILKPTVETLSLLPVSFQANIVRATIKAIIQAWQSYMYSCKIYFSVAGGLQLKQDLQYICNWMWKSSLSCQVIEEVMACEKLLKFSALTDFLATPENRPVQLISRQNRVVPVSLGSVSTLSESDQRRLPVTDLSDEEKEHWRPLKKKSTTVCGLCTCYYCK